MIQKEIYIGDKSKFAIRFAHAWSDETSKDNFETSKDFAYCHLVLDGQIIGRIDEPCYLKTWLFQAKWIKNQISNQFEFFKHDEFTGRTDEEIFELVWKSNQLEEQFDPKFSYLPVLDNKIWRYCHLGLDETIDAYLITITENNGAVKFIWKLWRNLIADDRIGKLFALTVDRDFVIETFEKCFLIIEEELRN